LSAVGIDPRHHRASRADLVQRDGQRPLALLPGQGGNLGRVAVGDDPGHPGRVGQPPEVCAVGGLVDGQVRSEGQEVGGHDPRKLHHEDTSFMNSFEDTTRPYARPMMSRVACWISGQSVATPSSTTVTRYSRWNAPTTVASTQMSVNVPVTTRDVMPRARRAPSSGVPAKAS